MLSEEHGNLLQADADALVNTVNVVGVMGKGIALQFKRAYPENFRAYERACKAKRVRLGEVFVVEMQAVTGPRYIINFPTKDHWRSNSKLSDVEAGLKDLVRVVKELNLRSIAVPPLGCGNGGLRWEDVYPLIEAASAQVPETHFMVFPPEGAPRANEMPIRTKRPAMTEKRAALLVALNQYVASSFAAGQALEYEFSLVEAQKVVYFLQLAGWDSSYEYAQGHYGPYAQAVDQTLSAMEGHFISGYGDGTSGSKAVLKLDCKSVEEAYSVMDGYADYFDILSRFDELVRGFEFPYGMELLSTVHFIAANHTPSEKPTAEAVVQGIRAWSDRKAELFKPHQARVAYQHLAQTGALAD